MGGRMKIKVKCLDGNCKGLYEPTVDTFIYKCTHCQNTLTKKRAYEVYDAQVAYESQFTEPEVKPLGVSVSDGGGQNWKDKVN